MILHLLAQQLTGGTQGEAAAARRGMTRQMWAAARAMFQPLIAAIYPLPMIALLPLILLIFGLGEMSKYVIVAIGVFFLVAIKAEGALPAIMHFVECYRLFGKEVVITMPLEGDMIPLAQLVPI